MQSQENSRESPYSDVGLPASADISLCETAGRLRGRLLVSIRRRFINKTAEPLVVVKLCGGEATNSPVGCSSTPCCFAASRQNAGHAFGP